MAVELILKFTDEAGAKRSVKVDASPFAVGRGADCELQIASAALSRRHAEIGRFGDVFVISDLGSSNGSEVNGAPLVAPVALKDADKIELGAAIGLTVEIVGAPVLQSNYDANQSRAAANAEKTDAMVSWKALLIIAPILGVIVLVLAGVALFALSGGGNGGTRAQIEPEDRQIDNSRLSEKANDNDDDDSANDEPEPPKSNRRSANSSANNNSAGANVPPPIETNNELDAVERNALIFLRSASGDSNPVLSSKQVEVINSKIKNFKNSAAVRENVKTARAQKAQFEKIGAEHNLRPAMLAAAALAKLGDSRGDAVATANQIATDLNRYAIVFGTELANDSLLTVAAYAQGDPPNSMRDRIANLTKNAPNSSAAIVRTIWFLKENDKLSQPAFDFAVRFIAVGAMLQEDVK